MITKIIKIKNVSRFADYSARGDVNFNKSTLIYGENGRGKTTLCNILRSLQSKSTNLILERKTIGATSDPEIILRTDQNFSFADNHWNEKLDDLLIYDSKFVNENVYTGESIEHSHKKNLYNVIVGQKGVEYAEKIKEINDKINKINPEIRVKEANIQKLVSSEKNVTDILNIENIEDIDTKIQSISEEIDKTQLQINQTEPIKNAGVFSNIIIPTFPDEFFEILSKSMDNIDEEAERKVKEHIINHMSQQNESWLSNGVRLVKDEKCPFCESDLSDNELIKSYRSYFNEEYKKLKVAISSLKPMIDNFLNEAQLLDISNKIDMNNSAHKFWNQHLDYEYTEMDAKDITEIGHSIRSLCNELIRRKRDNPLDKLIPEQTLNEQLSKLTSNKESFELENQKYEQINQLINDFKSKLPNQSEIEGLKNKLEEYLLVKRRYSEGAVVACKEYTEVISNKSTLETEKDYLKTQLEEYTTEIFNKYQEQINVHLKKFGASFQICETTSSYRGGAPSAQYQIKINDISFNIANSDISTPNPCFENTLSSGDRNTLALSFFLTSLEYDEELRNKTIVFDDPFTSLDRFRRDSTAQILYELSKKVDQLIVLSHDPYFLNLLFKRIPNTSTQTLRIGRTRNGSVILPWDIKKELESDYLKNYSILIDYYNDSVGELASVARAIRPFLESHYRSHYPGYFLPYEWLGDFIVKLRDAEDTSGLAHSKDDLPEIEAINEYSKKYHHDQNTNADSEIIVEDELLNYVQRTLAFVGVQ